MATATRRPGRLPGDRAVMPGIAVVEGTIHVLQGVGCAIIVIGAFGSLLRFAWAARRRANDDGAFPRLRSSLGRSILLGLEFLVAADIINTVTVDLTLRSLAVLGGIVAIRTP